MFDFTIDALKCNRCGCCVSDCSRAVIRMDNDALPSLVADAETLCIRCQHCFAVCPKGALSIFGLDPAMSLPLDPETLPTFEMMERLIRGRRTTRRYTDEPVSQEMVARLLAAVAHAPTGGNFCGLAFHVVDNRAAMVRLLDAVAACYAEAQTEGRDIAPLVTEAVEAYRNDGADLFFRGAPQMLIVTPKTDTYCVVADTLIAVSYFELLAQSAGLGTTWCGYLSYIIDAFPQLRARLGLRDNAFFYTILFGYPAHRYARTVQRDDAAEIRHLTL